MTWNPWILETKVIEHEARGDKGCRAPSSRCGLSSAKPAGAGPRDATRGGVNCPAPPGKRGRESPLWIDDMESLDSRNEGYRARSSWRQRLSSAELAMRVIERETGRCRAARRDARRGELPGSAGQEGAGKPPMDR